MVILNTGNMQLKKKGVNVCTFYVDCTLAIVYNFGFVGLSFDSLIFFFECVYTNFNIYCTVLKVPKGRHLYLEYKTTSLIVWLVINMPRN